MEDLVQALSLMPEPAKALVWRIGFSDWRNASELAELFPYVVKPPPLPPALPSLPSKPDNSALTTQRGASDIAAHDGGDGTRIDSFAEHRAGGLSVLDALFSFRGRLNRTQYALIFIIAYLGPMLIAVAIGEDLDKSNGYLQIFFFALIVWLPWVFFASLTKRLHDTDRPGTYCLFVFVPVVGSLTVLIMFFARGTQGTNQYGPPP
jgi:uncharacterized membrane protein YhaH (DUF805 family)